MGRREKGEERREGEGKEEGLMARKYLRRCVLVGKRGRTCTTPPPKWRLKDNNNNNNTNDDQVKSHKPLTEFLSFETSSPTVSARRLCATLWDSESHKIPVAKMGKGGLRTRRRRHKANGFCGLQKNSANLSAVNREDQPETASSFGRASSASLIQCRRSVERSDDRALQPVSPASFRGSSMEIAPYKHAAAPTSSVDLKLRRVIGSSYSLKTSTELIKVLNRIWSLEEQNTSNASLVRALEMELDRSRARINELLHEKESDRQEMDELVKQVMDDKIFRKSVEQDRIRSAIQSVRDELEDERKLRKRSEGLHRKLAREISELKSSFANALRELERERKARILLENLCDEFAKGISEYEREVRMMKHKVEKEHSGADQPDRLILHISEAWLDERMQMKLAEAENNIAEKISIVDKLGFDIATFLQAKQAVESKSRRYSLESFALNENVSAPRNPAEEDSTDIDSHCLEASKRDVSKESKSNDAAEDHRKALLAKSNSSRRKVRSQELIKGTTGLSNLQGQFEERMTRAISCKGNKTEFVDEEEQGSFERQRAEGTEDLKTEGAIKPNHAFDSLVRNRSLSTEGKAYPESCCREDSCISKSLITGNASPIQPWKSRLTTPDFEKSESSSRWPQDLDENTLMTQLIEARLEKRRRSRPKHLKESF